ncbi:hypothetical protein Phi47:1_gp64 [Cellulophaga phage phi47:1]|nr:hypothetical protein Phi3ST:2_gp64 [Cellulophaga phage phi3ST:2]AGO48259.1 hypothetical protein PhiSM_gp64 [Cellulophaga phage phiSM]AGO49303.1 hypothetical protein Phi38:2_gp64 [Cellulophaga phage phi38:2]AGO49383.1 hypothetical protein Phi3:1_gp64 [Cellulophaga phage phi3:1]AGO49801.1 hypothetical protein Phi47:1_gp64 [Cellulophaga phage phi47:1]
MVKSNKQRIIQLEEDSYGNHVSLMGLKREVNRQNRYFAFVAVMLIFSFCINVFVIVYSLK